MASVTAEVASDVLLWARKSSGLSLEDAAKKLRMPSQELGDLEAGIISPTLQHLRKMVDVYKRPLAVFFLPQAPKDFDVMRDFRLLPGTQDRPYSPALLKEFRRINFQREVALQLAEMEGDHPNSLELSLSLETDPESAGNTMQAWLGPFEGAGDLNQWIRRVETKRVLVTQLAGIDLNEMRGCSISEQPFPVVMLNGKDSPRARIFTLIHELAHILLHVGGLCDLTEPSPSARSERERVERFCNNVAASTLMPREQLLKNPLVASARPGTRWAEETLEQLAEEYGVSREAILIRLIELDRASWQHYFERRAYLLGRIEEEPNSDSKKRKGGPSYYRMKLRDYGRLYVTSVLDAYYREDITGSELSDYLDIKISNIDGLENELVKQR